MSIIPSRDGTELWDKHSSVGISELSSRSANSVDVAFRWRQCDDGAIISAVDDGTGREFVLDPHENEGALNMFHHRYAAHGRLDHRWGARGEGFRIAPNDVNLTVSMSRPAEWCVWHWRLPSRTASHGDLSPSWSYTSRWKE